MRYGDADVRLDIFCPGLVLVACDGEIIGVLTPSPQREIVCVPHESPGQSITLHADVPFRMYSAEEE